MRLRDSPAYKRITTTASLLARLERRLERLAGAPAVGGEDLDIAVRELSDAVERMYEITPKPTPLWLRGEREGLEALPIRLRMDPRLALAEARLFVHRAQNTLIRIRRVTKERSSSVRSTQPHV